MSFSGGEIQVGLTLNDALTPALRTAAAAIVTFEGNATSAVSRLSYLAGPIAAIGGIGAAFIAAGRAAGGVQQQVANLNASLNATPQQLALIRAQGLALSQQTQFNDQQIIASQRLLAKAHQETAAIIAQTPNVLNLASATQSDPTTATRLYVAAQKEFRRTTQDSADTVNILAKAIDSSVGDATAMAAGLKQVGPAAQSAGLNLRETATALADLQNAGLQNQSGTALKVFLQHIEHETPQARREVEKLGLSFYDSNGKMRSYADLLDEIRTKTIGMTDEARQASLYTIFGARAAQVADIGAAQGGAGFRDTAAQMASIGSASEIAAQKLDTVQGSMHKLGSSINVMLVQGGTALLPFFKTTADGATNLQNALTSLNAHIPLIPQLGVAGAALGAEVFAGRQLSSFLADRRAKAQAPDEAANQGYLAREQARYQQELDQYEQYQSRLITFQQEEAMRLDQHNLKIEALELAHQDRLTAIQDEAATKRAALPVHGGKAATELDAQTARQVAAQEQSFQRQMATQGAFVMSRPPAAIDAPLPVSLPLVADVSVKEAQLAAGGLAAMRARAGTLLAGAGSLIGKVALPLTIAVTAKELILDPITRDLNQQFADTFAKTINIDLYSADPETRKAKLQADLADQQRILDQFVKKNENASVFEQALNKVPIGPTPGSSNDAVIAKAKEQIAAINRELDATTATITNRPAIFQQEEVTRAQELAAKVSDGKLSAAQATAAFLVYTEALDRNTVASRSELEVARDRGLTEAQANAQLAQATKLFNQNEKAIRDQIRAEDDLAQANYEKRQAALDAGASTEQISRAIYEVTGTGAEASKQQVAEAQHQIDALTKKAEQAASDTEAAWKAALGAVSALETKSGTASSFAGIANSSDALVKAQRDLTALGQSDKALNVLVGVSTQFRAIDDAVERASAGLNAYNLTLTETNKYMQEIGSLQSEFEAALNAAERRQRLGTATPEDTYLIQHKADIYGQLDKTTDSLSRKANVDILGKLQNLPDYEKAADLTKTLVDQYPGGRKQLLLDIQTNTEAAEAAITAWIDKKRNPIHIDVSVAPPDYPSSPVGSGTYSSDRPPSRYDDYRGQSGSPPPPPGSYPPGPPPGALPPSGATATPRGNAVALLPYQGLIERAASAYGVPDWLIGAVIMHESGGIPGKVEEGGGLGRGLMQVDLGQHPDMYSHQAELTGTSAKDIAFQINTGAKILADSIATAKNLPGGVQGYAGSAYQSQAGGGVPAGLGFYNELDTYYRQQVMNALQSGGPGGKGAGGYAPGVIAASENLTTQQSIQQLNDVAVPSGAVGSSSVLAAAKARLGQKLDSAGREVYGWCEEIVDDILGDVQEDPRGKGFTGTADQHLRAAMAGTPGAGRVIDRSQAVPGDIVGWTGDNPSAGDPRGHIGIYSGDNKYIGTTQNGVQERVIPPGAIFIRPDGVVAGGPEPGTVLSRYTQRQIDSSEHLTATQGSGPPEIGTRDATAPGATSPALNYAQVAPQLAKINAQLATMTNADISKVQGQFREILPVLTQIEEKARQIGDHPLTQEDKQDAANAALERGLKIESAMALAENSITNGVQDLTPAINAVVAAAGPLGPMLAQQLATEKAIHDNNVQQAADKAVLLDGERQHNQLLIDRQRADETQQRQDYVIQYNDAASKRADDEAYTRIHWRIQDNRDTELRGIEDAKTKENDRWTTRSRQLEDEGRQLDQYGSNQKRQLRDNLDSLEKQHKATVASFTSQEQMLGGLVSGSGSRASKNNLREQLAIVKDYDRQTQLTYAKQKESIQDAITAEDKLVSQEKYDFETKKLKETRAHEDEMARLDKLSQRKQRDFADQDKTDQRNKQNADWRAADTAARDAFNHQQAMWQLQDRRNKEDEDYNAWHDGMQNRIDQETEWGKKLDADLALSKQMVGEFSSLLPLIGDLATQVFAGVGVSTQSPVTGAATSYTNPRGGALTPDQILRKALGLPYALGTRNAAPGLHIVGEGPEVIAFNGGEKVLPWLGGRDGGGSSSSSVTQNVNVALNLDSGLAELIGPEAMARINAAIKSEVKVAFAAKTRNGARGDARMTA